MAVYFCHPTLSAVIFFSIPSHLHLLPTLITALRSETPSFPNGNPGQGSSSEPAFAGSSDGTRGRDVEMRRLELSPKLSLGPDDRASSFSAAIARAAFVHLVRFRVFLLRITCCTLLLRMLSMFIVACFVSCSLWSSCFVIIIELPRNALTRNAGDLESALVPRVSGRVSSHAIGSMSGS